MPTASVAWSGDLEIDFDSVNNFMFFTLSDASSNLVMSEFTITGDLTINTVSLSGSSVILVGLTAGAAAPGSASFTFGAAGVTPNLDADIVLSLVWNINGALTLTDISGAMVPGASSGLVLDERGADFGVFSWTDGDDGGAAITDHQYRVQAGTTPGGTPISTGSVSTTHRIPNLMPSTEYTAQFRSVNGVGLSDWSNAITFTTKTQITLSAPTILFHGASGTVMVALSSDATDFVAADMIVTNGMKGAFAEVDGSNYTLDVTAPLSGSGDITVRVPVDSVLGGNPEVSVTIAYSINPSIVSIESIDEQTIPIGTLNYELEIGLTGDLEDDEVYIQGNYEGFYYDLDLANDRVFLKIPEARRLVLGGVFVVHARDETADIIYNVVPAAPVIVDPGEVVFWREANNSQFVEIANVPSSALVDGDVVGLTHEPSENLDGDMGVVVTGGIEEDASFGSKDLGLRVFGSNDTDEDMMDVDFEILDKPNIFAGAFAFEAVVANSLFKFSELTPNNTEVKTFDFGTEGVAGFVAAGMFIGSSDNDQLSVFNRNRVGELCVLFHDYGLDMHRLIFLDISGVARKEIISPVSFTASFPDAIDDPFGISNYRFSNLNEGRPQLLVLDRTDRRAYAVRLGEDGGQVSIERTGPVLSAAKPVGIWVDVSAHEANSPEVVYVLDRGANEASTKSIYIYDRGLGLYGILRSVTPSVRRRILLPSEITAPAGLTLRGDWIYIVDDGDPGETGSLSIVENSKVYRIAENTPNNTEAVVNRVWTIPDPFIFCSSIWTID